MKQKGRIKDRGLPGKLTTSRAAPVFLLCFFIPAGLLLGFTIYLAGFALPDPLFSDPYSLSLTDKNGVLLSASIAGDGQWRFPPATDGRGRMLTEPPAKFSAALINYEDRRFFRHNGFDLLALGRAVRTNLRQGRIVSGASTLSMQVIRLSRKGKPRVLGEKIKETILAMYLSLLYDKNTVLGLFAAHAPFGGNVVGLQAASWRYFGRPPDQISWADAAVLAVLPNSPGLIHPGRNRDELLRKRNFLLDKLHFSGHLSSMELSLAKGEALPPEPHPLPQEAPHLLERFRSGDLRRERPRDEALIRTGLDGELQKRLNELAANYGRRLQAQEVQNLGLIVMDTQSAQVLAYVGNIPLSSSPAYYVDMVSSRRSTGSLLKPFLYTAMIDSGELLPRQLVLDIPTRMGTYMPENSNHTYLGAVPATEALAQSLNVPAARMLRDFGVHRFYGFLTGLGIKTLDRPADHYGISLVLGGAEGTLENLTALYASLARTVLQNSGDKALLPPSYLPPNGSSGLPEGGSAGFHPGSAYLCLRALEEVVRPEEEGNWQDFLSSRPVSWKTGTSYGFRDAWAIGCTPGYTVGVWAGNASGEGNAAIQGSRLAAPLLFQVMGILNDRETFTRPSAMISLECCRTSGYLAGPDCPEIERTMYPPVQNPGSRCPYHRIVSLDKTQSWRLAPDEAGGETAVQTSWFVLPPAVEWYYSRWNINYRPLPPRRNTSRPEPGEMMELPFPSKNEEIYIPIELDGSPGAVVFEAFPGEGRRVLYWHLDGYYAGSTEGIHQISLRPAKGEHTLTVIDDLGQTVSRKFSVLSD